MREKSFAIIGLGYFGITVAETLAEFNQDVMVIDDSEEKIQEIESKVTYAIVADVKEPGILKKVGIQDMDVVIITITEDIEASIVATLGAKDLGVPLVIAKALNETHGRILAKIGADEIIYPEKSMGIRVARNLISSGFLDYFELSENYTMAEFPIPKEWVGKTLSELALRQKYDINLVGIKVDEKVTIGLDPKKPFPENCIILAAGENKKLDRFSS